MLYFLLIILAGIGITNLVVKAEVLEVVRDFVIKRSKFFGKLITCMMCTGFWVGLILGLFPGLNPAGFNALMIAAIVSLCSFNYGLLIEYVELLIALKSVEINEIEIDE